jgi:hypothetical protein
MFSEIALASWFLAVSIVLVRQWRTGALSVEPVRAMADTHMEGRPTDQQH